MMVVFCPSPSGSSFGGEDPKASDDHAAYLAHWLKVLKADNRAIFTAASRAQRAADYLHQITTAEEVAA